MGSFETPLRVERLDGDRRFRVLEGFVFIPIDGKSIIRVPEGFVTDFASIPRFFWRMWPPVGGDYDKAAVVHDYLYDNPGDRTRVECDDVLKDAMETLGVGRFTRFCIYRGVRLGGRGIWNNHRQRDEEAARVIRS